MMQLILSPDKWDFSHFTVKAFRSFIKASEATDFVVLHTFYSPQVKGKNCHLTLVITWDECIKFKNSMKRQYSCIHCTKFLMKFLYSYKRTILSLTTYVYLFQFLLTLAQRMMRSFASCRCSFYELRTLLGFLPAFLCLSH